MYVKSEETENLTDSQQTMFERARESRGDIVIQIVDPEDNGVYAAYAFVGHVTGNANEWAACYGGRGRIVNYTTVLMGLTINRDEGFDTVLTDHEESLFASEGRE